MNLQSRSYKFRIYPNPKQQLLLNQTFGSVRFYWNYLLSSFINKEKAKTEKELKTEFDWLTNISAASLQLGDPDNELEQYTDPISYHKKEGMDMILKLVWLVIM